MKAKADFGITPKSINSNAIAKIVTGLTKSQLRSRILSKLKAQKEEDRNLKSKIIKEKLFRTQIFKKAKRVMFYFSFDGEVDTQDMIKEAQKLGKVVALPVCKKNRNRIVIRPCILHDKAGVQKGPYGICEPILKRAIKLEDLDLVIVPGVAFDKRGNRLGRGGGCYDRFLKRLLPRISCIGLAFDFQILPSIPTTKRDVNINRVISNEDII